MSHQSMRGVPLGFTTSMPPVHRVHAAHGDTSVEERLTLHLRSWLGVWPPEDEVQIVVGPRRDVPGWNGDRWLGLGVESPAGTVLSISPRLAGDAALAALHVIRSEQEMPDRDQVLAAPLRKSSVGITRATFRWSQESAVLPEIGEWVPHDDPRLPAWLHVFDSEVLVVWDDAGEVAAGVGVKQHNRYGHELAVVTEPSHQGRGLARMLVAQAGRRILAHDAVPLYFHLPDNIASARVADTAGFPDRGWRVVTLY